MKFIEDSFTDRQRQEIKALLIEKYEYFYHYTEDINFSSICAQGLNPDKDNSFCAACTNRPDAIFFYTDSKHEGLVENQRQLLSLENRRLVIFRVRSTFLLDNVYGLDWTTSHTAGLTADLFQKDCEVSLLPEEAVEIIRRVGFLVCYDCVPISEMEISYDHGKNFQNIK